MGSKTGSEIIFVTLNTDHGTGIMPYAGKHYAGVRSRIAPLARVVFLFEP